MNIKLMTNVIIQRATTVRTVITQSVRAVTDVKRISVDIRSSLSIRTGFTESLLAWINDFVKEI